MFTDANTSETVSFITERLKIESENLSGMYLHTIFPSSHSFSSFSSFSLLLLHLSSVFPPSLLLPSLFLFCLLVILLPSFFFRFFLLPPSSSSSSPPFYSSTTPSTSMLSNYAAFSSRNQCTSCTKLPC